MSAYRSPDTRIPLSDHTIGSLLVERAATYPDRIALIATPHGSNEIQRLTYRQLYTCALQVAGALRELCGAGEYVALWAPIWGRPPRSPRRKQPRTIDHLLNQTVGKVLDQFDIEHSLFDRWS
ncbi:AMP-binding protein [Nocardia uniformis]|uniref:AMP-binding protein n=1 Tax=Nocardia uniformis TaxID=53432 RepID=UPI0008336798|nr:AMP-binding protein [Nocardia uniformis]